MPKRVQRIRHDTATAAAFTGLEGEITVDLGNKTLRVHDGLTPGGKVIALNDAVTGILFAANNLSDVINAATSATNLGLGVSSQVAFLGLDLTHALSVIKTAIETSDHAISIGVNTAGFSDVKCLEIDYDVSTMATGLEDAAINVNVNKTASIGGKVLGINVDSTDGAAEVINARSGAGVAPIYQASGIFINPTFASNNTTATDVPTMRDGSDGTTNGIMVADNNYIIFGAATAYSQLSLSFTVISSKDIQAEYFYSIAGTNQFTQFFPLDGTDGMQNSAGIISWDISTFVGHVADTATGTFNIKIVRTRNGAITNPVLGHAETSSIVIYEWDKDGLLTVNDIQLTTGGLMQTRLNSIETVNTAQDVRLTDNEANIITNATDIMAPIPVVTGGTTSAYTATLGIASYVNNSVYELRMHLTCIDNPTLALDGLATLSIYILAGDFIRLVKSDDLLIGSIARFRYDGIRFVIVNTQDYQSTYNVTLSPSTSGSITLNSNFLAYFKRARLATVTGKITVLSVSSPVGFLVLPLPYPAASLSGDSASGLVSVNFQAIGTPVDLGLYGEIAGSNIQIYEQLSTGQGLTVANKIATGTILLFNFSYITE